MEDIVNLEKRRADAIAEEYLNKGYEVSRGVVLDFFPGFRADLVVKRGDEVKVIEVKTRTSYAREPAINQLADVLQSMPGWSFVLDLVGEPEVLYSPEDARPIESADVVRRIKDSERLLETGFSEAAMLLAWSACEAALRILIEREGTSIRRITNSAYTLGAAVSEGVISRDDYNYLTDVMKHRNTAFHGFRSDRFDEELVTDLLETTKRLIFSTEMTSSETAT